MRRDNPVASRRTAEVTEDEYGFEDIESFLGGGKEKC
jgi:hypothetical protein